MTAIARRPTSGAGSGDGTERPSEPSGTAVPSPVVVRPRLLEQIDRIPPSGVGLICAPAGSGKSLLLRQWMERAGSCAHLRLTSVHNEPFVFAKDLAASISRAVPGFDCGFVDLAPMSGPRLGNRASNALLLGLEELPHPLTVIFDDVHTLDVGGPVGDLPEVLNRLPDNVRVILATRWDPAIRLLDLRLEGRLIEVRADDLAFDAAEARELIHNVSGRDLTDEQVEAIVRRTGGWAAGLQMAAITLERALDVDASVRGFTGSNRLVAEYLIQEVLADLEPEIRRFLLLTSSLRWLTPELCDAVTGGDDSREMIELLTRRSLFTTPTEEGPDRTTYHPLFADLLRYHLRATDPAAEHPAHLAAARWLVDHGHLDLGIEQLLAAREPRQVGELVARSGQSWFEHEEAHVLLRWLATAEEMDPEPPISLQLNLLAAQCAAHQTGAQIETYRRFRRRTDLSPWDVAPAAAMYATGGMDDLPTTEVRKAAGEAVELLGRYPDAAVENVLGLGGRDTFESIASIMLAVADLHDGRVAESDARFEAALELPGTQYRIWRPYALGGLALARGLAGRLRDAEAFATSAVEAAEANHVGRHHSLAYAHFALALVAIDRRAQAAMIYHLHESELRVERTRRASHAALQAVLRIEQVAAANGATAAVATCDAAIQIAPSPPLVTDLSFEQSVRLLIATGRLAKARNELDRARPSEHLAQVIDLELASGQVAAANAALERWPEDGLDVRTSVERSIRVAAVFDAIRRPSRAEVALQVALELAEPEGLRRPFLEQPTALRLLRKQSRRASRVFERSIIESASARDEKLRAVAHLPEPLTDRELEVLDYLPTRLSNHEVAAALFVSINTLKSHLRHIYAKLEVTDRDAAVERASELGIL